MKRLSGLLIPIVVIAGAGPASAQVVLSPATQYPTGPEQEAILAFDVDGDSDRDLVVDLINPIGILRNEGGATYGPFQLGAATTYAAVSLAAADLNGDQLTDLVVGQGGGISPPSTGFTVRFSDGLGGFGPGTFHGLPSGAFPIAIAVGDLNGDQAVDLAVATALSNAILIYLNTGSGTYVAGQTIGSVAVRSIVLADVDGDQDLDIVASEQNGVGNVRIHRNVGLGSFVPAGVFPAGSAGGGNGVFGVACADLDGDLDLDVVGTIKSSGSTPPALGGKVVVLRNLDGMGMLGPPVLHPAGTGLDGIGAADLDGDDRPEVVVLDRSTSLLYLFANDGMGNLLPPSLHGVGFQPTGLALADLDQDGDLDLATCNISSEDVSVLLNLTPTSTAVPYPGTGEDLVLLSGVNGPATTGPGLFVKAATTGDLLALHTTSPGGTFAAAPYVLVAQVFPTGMPPAGPLPSVHVDPTQMIVVVDGASGPFPLLVGPSGAPITTIVPPGLVGASILWQAAALGPLAANGFFATTDAHEIQVTAAVP